MAREISLVRRSAEFSAALLLALALAGMQGLIGGTRLIFSLPIYGLLALVALLSLFSLRNKTRPDRVCLFSAAIFFGYVLVRAWFSPVPYQARADIFSVLGGLIVYLFTGSVFTSAKGRIRLLVFLVLVALLQVLIGAIQFRDDNNFMLIPFLQRFDYGRRASGFYVCPNHFAGLVEVLGIFCLSLVCWSRWPVWGKLLIGYAGAMCYVGLALTGSRGGYVSAAFSLVVLVGMTLLVLRKAGGAIFWRTALFGAVLGLLLAAALFLGFKNSRYLSGRAQNVFDTQNMRLDLWQAAVAEWKLQPFIGTGSGTYLYYGRRFRTARVQLDPVEVHNDYLHLLCEYGLIGAVTFLLFLGAHLRRGWQSFQRLGPRRIAVSLRLPSNTLALNLGAIGAIAALIIHSFFDFNLHIPANVLLLAFVFGILANDGVEREEERIPAPSRFPWNRLVMALLAVLLAWACVRYLPAAYFAERARVALRDERHVAAMAWADKAIARDQENPETWFYLGESRVRRAEITPSAEAKASFERAAIVPFEHALELAPNDETFLIALGRVYDSLGRYPEAEWMFGRAVAWDPKSDVVKKSYAAHLAFWKTNKPATMAPQKLDLPDKNAPVETPAPVPSPGGNKH
ncbi:MAG TPA: O-antigen ligase family protein [Chthoniobacterales bacterium]